MEREFSALKIVLAYFVFGIGVIVVAFLVPGQDESVASVPVLVSLFSLIPLYAWYRSYMRKRDLSNAMGVRDKSEAVFWVFALFLLAMFIRIPSVVIFGVPFEKTPVIFLTISTIMVIEKTDLSAFGFTTRKPGKSLAYGAAFFFTANILATIISYLLIYNLTNRMAFETFDPVAFLLVLPFMTLCVGICEEGLFRGYIQNHLEKLSTTRSAILVQAILFGAWHFVWDLSPFNPFDMAQRVLTTFLFGLLFGYFYSKTRSLTPLVLAHGLWDSVALGIVVSQPAYDVLAKTSASTQAVVFFLPYAIGALVTFVFIRYFVTKIDGA
ncbi:MAG TPA: type II CAAX endopeptidase family protein [candidate division Zixibacteria bacterium]|nr:type II CAAX endopeptidase family protein [candidate division Zixibacteria bacterium]